MFKKKKTLVPKISYFICSNRRTGGTLLCDLLQQTNMAGYPAEYATPFLPTAAYRQDYIGATSDKQFISKVLEASTTPNGVFGIKLHSYEIPTLLEKLRAEELVVTTRVSTVREIFEARFPNLLYVWVLRKDKIQQAISLYKALNSRVWWDFIYYPPMYKQIETPNTVFDYDFEKIKECLALVKNDDAIWEHFFTYNKLEPLVIYYEDFAADYVTGTKKVLAYLGLPTDIDIPEPRTRKQSDKISEDWEKRFREELGYQEEY